jgi:PKD repeat protein
VRSLDAMFRRPSAALLVSLVLSLAFAAGAAATPATPSITVQQQDSLKMRLTASTGTHWAWTIADAGGAVVATSAGNPYTLTLPAAGDYVAMVDATDDDPAAPAAAHAETRFHVYAKPQADFTAAQQADGTIQLTDASTGEPTAWTWTFPDGSTFKGRVPPPRALPVGTSTVALKVTNPAGNSSISKPVVVNGPPVAVLSVLSSPAATGAPILLDASRSTDPNGDALTYAWDLTGDGVFADGAGALQTVAYAAPGRYRVGVQVSDGHGAVSTAEAAITVVADQPPVVAFATDPDQPPVGGLVTLTATASDPDGSVARIEWDLDDDGAFDDAAGARATWSFATPGAHRVAVRAVDDRGVATVAFRAVIVPAPPPIAPATVEGASTGPFTTSSAPRPAIPNGPAPSRTSGPSLLAPFPIVRIRGVASQGVVKISLLRVQSPAGTSIRVRCRGGSCAPRRADVRVKAARSPTRLTFLDGRPLRAGTIVEVFVTAPHRIGKYTRFKVRRDAAPARTDACLAPGKVTPTACPTA